MAKHITIRVPGKHPQTGEITTFELKGQRMDIDIGGQAVPFLIHGRGIETSLTHIPSGYRIALLGGWLTARYAIPENKPSRTACAQMAIDRLVAHPVRLAASIGPAQLQAGYQSAVTHSPDNKERCNDQHPPCNT
ncbi:hypothetical protein ACE1B4_23110 [Aeromonas veronii]|uniref:hypothetical protein n=1 Tax=Aeromonas veronii TaxID=654 RepID=UPI001F35DAA9|nr:hypothetical protein [Aeromonas veronii]